MATELLTSHRKGDLGSLLEHAVGTTSVVLHDHQLPGVTSQVEHVVIASSGVWLVDVNKHPGLADFADRGNADAYRACVDDAGMGDVPVHAVVCIVDSEWSQRSNADVVNGVLVLSPDKLCSVVNQPGSLGASVIDALAAGFGVAAFV